MTKFKKSVLKKKKIWEIRKLLKNTQVFFLVKRNVDFRHKNDDWKITVKIQGHLLSFVSSFSKKQTTAKQSNKSGFTPPPSPFLCSYPRSLVAIQIINSTLPFFGTFLTPPPSMWDFSFFMITVFKPNLFLNLKCIRGNSNNTWHSVGGGFA